jgi:hypothetical protein
MKKSLIFAIAIIFFFVSKAQVSDEVYMFSYFVNNGEDGLHLAYSFDGLKWKALKNNNHF